MVVSFSYSNNPDTIIGNIYQIMVHTLKYPCGRFELQITIMKSQLNVTISKFVVDILLCGVLCL